MLHNFLCIYLVVIMRLASVRALRFVPFHQQRVSNLSTPPSCHKAIILYCGSYIEQGVYMVTFMGQVMLSAPISYVIFVKLREWAWGKWDQILSYWLILSESLCKWTHSRALWKLNVVKSCSTDLNLKLWLDKWVISATTEMRGRGIQRSHS